MRSLILGIALMSPLAASAQCWVVSNLHGYGAMELDKYEFSTDRITNGVFQIAIDGDKANLFNVGSSLVGSGLMYIPLADNTMTGIYKDLEKTTIETWSITQDNKVMYTKVINSSTIGSSTKAFVGDIVGTCTTKP